MRFLFIFGISLMLSGSAVQAQEYKYAIQTTQLASIGLYDASKGVLSDIPSYRRSSGGYLLECSNPNTSFLRLKNQATLVKINVFELSTKRKTGWIELKTDTMLSLSGLFANVPNDEFSLWTIGSTLVDAVVGFFNECRKGSVVQGNNAALQSTQRFFVASDSIEYSSPAQFYSAWKTEKPIQEIVLHSQTDTIFTVSDTRQTQLSYGDLSTEQQQKLKKGQHYTLTVVLTEDAETVSHKQDIYFFSEVELETLSQFLD